MRNWLAKKSDRWGSLEDAFRSHRQLESFRGVDETQLLKLEPSDKKEAWHGPGGIYEKLGRPASADKYEMPKVEGEGVFDLTQPFRQIAFDEGLSASQAKNIADKVNQAIQADEQARTAEILTAWRNDLATVQKEWGTNFEANTKIAEQGAAALGFDPNTEEGQRTLVQLQHSLGLRYVTMKMFEIGSRLGEHGGGDHGNQGGTSFMTPQNAAQRIADLKGDPNWVQRWVNGDPEANKEMQALHLMAYPPGSRD